MLKLPLVGVRVADSGPICDLELKVDSGLAN
jgi:hypothetical protein